jgi:ribulose kinase
MRQFEPPLGLKNVICTAPRCGGLYTFSGSGGKSSTGNMWKHIKKQHPELAAELSAKNPRGAEAQERAAEAYGSAATKLRQESGKKGAAAAGERKDMS